MSHAFKLDPDTELLNKHGYEYIMPLEIDSIWKVEQRLDLERKFKALATEYGLVKHYDTLLYIILLEHNNADIKFYHSHSVYDKHKRIKELAQLLLMFQPDTKHKPDKLQLSSAMENVKLTDQTLINWIGKLINQTIQELNLKPTELGEEVFDFISNKDRSILSAEQNLNYDKIKQYAAHSVRKPTIRERNKVLAPFLLNVLKFLNKETTLSSPPTIRFTDEQLNFLYNLANLLEWIDDKRVGSEGKDYLGTLLLNHVGK